MGLEISEQGLDSEKLMINELRSYAQTIVNLCIGKETKADISVDGRHSCDYNYVLLNFKHKDSIYDIIVTYCSDWTNAYT